MFWYATGKLRRVYDESLTAAAELQRGDSALYRLDPIDFGRRVAAEKELLAAGDDAGGQNAVFDDSGNFLIYSTLLGIKVRRHTCCSPCVLPPCCIHAEAVQHQPHLAQQTWCWQHLCDDMAHLALCMHAPQVSPLLQRC